MTPSADQESVWDYPRPPAIRECRKPVKIIFADIVLAETSTAICILETSHPPTYYIPPEDIDMQWLLPVKRTSFCEWKGHAVYFDIIKDTRHHPQVAWTYPEPDHAYAPIANYLAFYPQFMDGCFVGDEKVEPQAGGFYGGWVTSDIAGPFKGEPGTAGW